MEELDRLRNVVKWLFFKGYFKNNKELAVKLGFNYSYLSQVLNGKLPISKKFVQKLSSLDQSISSDWIFTGIGEMLTESAMKTNEKAIDRFDRYMNFAMLNDNKVTKDLGLSIGLLGKCRKPGRDLSRELIDKILTKYTDLSEVYLKVGKGEMLNDPAKLTPLKESNDGNMYKRLYELQLTLYEEVKKDRDRLQAIINNL